jgi:serine/threonine protein kinase
MAAQLPPHAGGAPQTAGSGGGAHDLSTDGLPCRFGKYTLIRKLAAGGMAELFLAIQKSVAGFEKLIVIKRILPTLNQDRAFIEMLLHEARIAATLSHPNIVQTFDVGAVDGTYFIAMEHVHGEDLRSIVRQMKKKAVVEFPLEHALSIVLGICSGLAYAHEKRDLDGTPLNIVHRDISPQNVVVTFTGDVKIVDFGIAKSGAQLHEHTRSGKLKGKIPYMSPEQARGEEIDWRSDIFAAGVMLFELTTGKRLFKAASDFETLKLICERDYPLPSQVRLGYPRELEAVVMRALAKDRTQRWQSAREMQAAIEEFVRRERLPVSTIALSQFMQGLFEDKLASQKQALLQGKQLADIIAVEHGPDSGAGVAGASSSSAAAIHTVSERAPRRRGGGWIVAALGIAAVVGAGVGARWWMKHHAAAQRAQAPAAAGAPAMRGALAIASDPPGAAIAINGRPTGEVTPATLTNLAIGTPYSITLTKDGFVQAAQTVTLSEQVPSSAVSVALQRGTMSLDVSIKPSVPGVVLSLDRHPLASAAVDDVSAGEPHQLVVSAPGYVAQTFSFTGAMGDRKHFDVTLTRAEAPRGRGRAAAAAPIPTGTGKLNVSAHGGWCNVTIDGAPRGPTPIAGVELSAGTHIVTCTPEGGRTMAATIRIEADSTSRYAFTIPP